MSSMRGRSEHNRHKQGEVYAIFRKLGGEATWTMLWEEWKTHERGKETLSTTLQAMERKETVKKEVCSRIGEGKGPRSQVWYILTTKGAIDSINDDKLTIEENLVILSKRTWPPGCEECIRDLMLRFKDFKKELEDFERQYDLIKKEGKRDESKVFDAERV